MDYKMYVDHKNMLTTKCLFKNVLCVHIHFVVHMHFVAMGSAENFFYQNMTSIGKMGHLYFLWGKLKTNKQCRFKICIFFIIGIIRNIILNFGVRLVAVDSILARKKSSCQLPFNL